MRRQGDDYINCTHIMKVCSYDKPKRTKTLEGFIGTIDGVPLRETGRLCEKIQGGFGKYQGKPPGCNQLFTQSTDSEQALGLPWR